MRPRLAADLKASMVRKPATRARSAPPMRGPYCSNSLSSVLASTACLIVRDPDLPGKTLLHAAGVVVVRIQIQLVTVKI